MKQKYFLIYLAAGLVITAGLLSIVPGFKFSIICCFCLAALLVAMHFLLKHPKGKHLCKIICIFLLVGAIAAAVTGGFIVSAAHPGELPACDYIVVLGAGVRGTVPSLTLSERIGAAYDYLSDHPDTTAILCGGQGPGEDMTEAACMYRELTRMGIDGTRLLQEDRSTSTIENLTFALDVAEEVTGMRPAKVGIVSSEYHIFRATRFAQDLELEAFGVPAKTTWFPLRLNYYLREIVAVWKYLLLGP